MILYFDVIASLERKYENEWVRTMSQSEDNIVVKLKAHVVSIRSIQVNLGPFRSIQGQSVSYTDMEQTL